VPKPIDPAILNDMNDDEYERYLLTQRTFDDAADWEEDNEELEEEGEKDAPRVYNYQPAPRANLLRRR
jgi:hypothetical protein